MDKDILEKEFIKWLHMGQLYKANAVVKGISFCELNNMLLKISFETLSLQPYAFIVFSILCDESADLHHVASVIMATALSHYEGAFSVGLLHARKAAALEPTNITHQEWLLSFYGIPDEVIDSHEAKYIVQKILTQDPSNSIALKVLEQIHNGF